MIVYNVNAKRYRNKRTCTRKTKQSENTNATSKDEAYHLPAVVRPQRGTNHRGSPYTKRRAKVDKE